MGTPLDLRTVDVALSPEELEAKRTAFEDRARRDRARVEVLRRVKDELEPLPPFEWRPFRPGVEAIRPASRK